MNPHNREIITHMFQILKPNLFSIFIIFMTVEFRYFWKSLEKLKNVLDKFTLIEFLGSLNQIYINFEFTLEKAYQMT